MSGLIVHAIVEIPAGSRNKYEYDETSGRFVLKRVLHSPMHYPAEYGYVEGTLAPDGDPLDILVLVTEATFPGCLIRARVVGVLDMADDKGKDHKLLAVPVTDPRYGGVNGLEDVHPHTLREIAHFFQVYKDLENRKTIIEGWKGAADAAAVYEDSVERFAQTK